MKIQCFNSKIMENTTEKLSKVARPERNISNTLPEYQLYIFKYLIKIYLYSCLSLSD